MNGISKLYRVKMDLIPAAPRRRLATATSICRNQTAEMGTLAKNSRYSQKDRTVPPFLGTKKSPTLCTHFWLFSAKPNFLKRVTADASYAQNNSIMTCLFAYFDRLLAKRGQLAGTPAHFGDHNNSVSAEVRFGRCGPPGLWGGLKPDKIGC